MQFRTSIILFLFYPLFLNAQAPGPMPAKHAGRLAMELKQMQVLGSALYIAAHPDDENTSMISYLAGELGVRTAYLSLTRGDGGQNLIGEESGSMLGVLRSQELLAARRVDGGEQMFSRAIDFGYSKTPKETQMIWDRQKILADVVWAIRKFRPDVIITRFAEPERGGGGHGHHTTSAILTREAFKLASDPNAFPEQLDYVTTWQPKRLFWNLYTWRRYNPDPKDLSRIVELNIDSYNSFLGKGYGEISAEARSMHKCQGFGRLNYRGLMKEKLLLLEGPMPSNGNLFEGIDISWNRLVDSRRIQTLLEDAFQLFRPESPHEIVPTLLEAYKLLRNRDEHYARFKLEKLRSLIAYCSGLYFEVNSQKYSMVNGDTVTIKANILKRSPISITLDHIMVGENGIVKEFNRPLVEQEILRESIKFVPEELPISQPYWLEKQPMENTFTVNDQSWIGLAENPAAMEAAFAIIFDNSGEKIPIVYGAPVTFKYADPSQGEIYRPFIVTPPVTVNIAESAYLFANGTSKEAKLQVQNHMDGPGTARISIELPEGWTSEPSEIDVSFERSKQVQILKVQIFPPAIPSKGKLKVSATARNQTFSMGIQEIAYSHIPTQTVFPPSTAELIKMDIKKAGTRVAYIMGSGDEIPASLSQIGYIVDLLGDDEVVSDNLKDYDAVILGIRAYNSREKLINQKEELFKYVFNGGTLITQFTTRSTPNGTAVTDIAPYPMTVSRDRVSDENARMKIIAPNHPVINFPNKITESDFDGWVQERGLYFPNKWDIPFTPIFQSNDPGESPKKGAMLIAKYGQGFYVYTGLSFFRQLPAGVPGAYRLFANMISLGKESQ